MYYYKQKITFVTRYLVLFNLILIYICNQTLANNKGELDTLETTTMLIKNRLWIPIYTVKLPQVRLKKT